MFPSDDELFAVAERFGTPTYLYLEPVLQHQFDRLSRSLGSLSHVICYAMKANSNLSLLKLLASWGSGFDTVSEGELRRIESLGIDFERVVFSGVGKGAGELGYAIERGVRFINLESESEFDLLTNVVPDSGPVVHLSIRINPDLVIEGHPHLATGHRDSKFGISVAAARELSRRITADRRFSLRALHLHVGSNVSDVTVLEAGYRVLLELANELRRDGAESLRELDFGGGFGVAYSGKYDPLDIEGWGAMVQRLLSGQPYSVIVEPGKFLVAECGVLLSKVEHVKRGDGKTFIVADAGMNDLARPAMYDAYHKISVVGGTGQAELADVVGPVCESGCFLGKDRKLPQVTRGALLAVHDAGAYGFSMASNYNSRRLPAEVLMRSDRSLRLVGAREEWESLWRREVLD